MDLHQFIGETRKITEAELLRAPEELDQAPEITAETIVGLKAEMPELEELDQEQLLKGMGTEAKEHWGSVGGDMAIIAKITKDHLLEFPGKDYYAALEQLESELGQAEEQEVATVPGEGPVEEPVTEPEVATEEPTEEPVAYEAKVAEGEDKWIQGAVDPKHKGYCTPTTKSTCTPRRKALAMRFKKGIENESAIKEETVAGGEAAVEKELKMSKSEVEKTHASNNGSVQQGTLGARTTQKYP